MKDINQHLFKQPQQVVFILVLTSILSLSLNVGLAVMHSATAAPIKLAQNAASQVNGQSDRLPSSVANAVIQDLSRREGIPASKLNITEYSRQTWTDGCLGLGKLNELCLQALVEGWRVVVSDGRGAWVYRTDSTGRTIRLETENNSAKLPAKVANPVLKDASLRSNVPISDLRIVQAEQQTWSDGCLGLAPLGVFCTAIAVPGWLVAVAAGQQILVYRTDESGGFRLDEAASSIPVPLFQSQLPPGVIFRSISIGGLAGITIETNLKEDGQLIQVGQGNANGRIYQTQTSRRVSQQQVQQFKKLLEQQKFSQFNALEYPLRRGAADIFTVTLTSRTGTTRYSDIAQALLPSRLQAVILAWNQLLSQK
jgi:hypothetical protein